MSPRPSVCVPTNRANLGWGGDRGPVPAVKSSRKPGSVSQTALCGKAPRRGIITGSSGNAEGRKAPGEWVSEPEGLNSVYRRAPSDEGRKRWGRDVLRL